MQLVYDLKDDDEGVIEQVFEFPAKKNMLEFLRDVARELEHMIIKR